MFRPFRRRIRQQAALENPPWIDLLNQANQCLNTGRFSEAGTLFARVALDMETARHPRRAANLHAQAAHAFASAQDEIRALTHARAALTLFTQFQMVRRTPQFYANILHKLRANGMQAAAAQLERDFSSLVPDSPDPTASNPAPSPSRGKLPASCPQCGAPVRSDEVEWIDATSAECIFCGSVLQSH
jgi:hypothetical protein